MRIDGRRQKALFVALSLGELLALVALAWWVLA